jgi:hypothetical protein
VRTHYSTDEFIELLTQSLKIHLDKACGFEYTNTHVDDLFINTEAYISALTSFILNSSKKG